MNRIAVVHPSTLLGRELCERLAARHDLCRELLPLSTEEAEIGVVIDGPAAALVDRVEEGAFDGVDLSFFCGAIAPDREALALLPAQTPAVLLSNGVTPADAPSAIAGLRSEALVGAPRVASAHPAAVALALLLDPLRELALSRADATLMLPVSLWGTAAIDELFGEARSLLTFAPRERGRRFPVQLAFNLLSSAQSAADVERQVLAALGDGLALSVGLVQAGVFHSVAVTLAVELDPKVELREVRRALAGSAAIEVARAAKEVGPVSVAGAERLVVGEIRAAARAGAFRIWAAMDNLVRGGALNAIELAGAMLAGGRPR